MKSSRVNFFPCPGLAGPLAACLSAGSCPFSHIVLACATCTVLCTSKKAFKQHLNSRRHLRRSSANATLLSAEVNVRLAGDHSASSFQCTICNKYFTSAGQKEMHDQSSKHRKSIRAFAVVQNEIAGKVAVDGIEILPLSLNLGRIDIGATKSFTFEVHNKTNELISFVECSNEDSAVAALTCGALHAQITPGDSLALCFDAVGRELGYFHRVLHFRLEKPTGVVALKRTISATIGMDESELKPKIPFKRLDKTHDMRNGAKILKTGAIDGLGDPTAKYQRKLPRFAVPEYIREALSGNCGNPLSVFSNKLIPRNPRKHSQYSAYYHNLLWAEEVQLETDIRQYSMFSVELKESRSGRTFALHVDGLAEKRPSVLRGDSVFVRATGQTGPVFDAKAVKVELETVHLAMHKAFQQQHVQGQLYDIQFSVGRTPWRRMHHAIALCSNWDFARFDSPFYDIQQNVAERAFTAGKRYSDAKSRPLKAFNGLVDDNEEQRLAVAIITDGFHHPLPFLLFGPPGTGKTSTIVEAINQITHLDPTTKILVCAPSNTAADVLLERLSRTKAPDIMFRLNAFSRNQPSTFSLFEKYVFRSSDGFDVPTLDTLKQYQIVVSTCVSSAILGGIGIPASHFTHVFIDEAGQAMEPEVLIPIATFGNQENTRIVLAGDHRQLGPIVHSAVATHFGLGISLLERFMHCLRPGEPTYSPIVAKLHCQRLQPHVTDYDVAMLCASVKLLKNYRSHEDILKTPNELFYDGELLPCADPKVTRRYLGWGYLPNKETPILFVHTEGKDEREAQSPSWFNTVEVKRVLEILESISDDRSGVGAISGEEIGIITPYNRQAQKLRQSLSKKFPKIMVGTVELFQGQEKDIIILSTVRSNPDFLAHDQKFNLGFLNDPKRFNVAVTRARSLLVVVGNANILSLDPSWSAWMKHAYSLNAAKNLPASVVDRFKSDLVSSPTSGDMSSKRSSRAASVFSFLSVSKSEAEEKLVVTECLEEEFTFLNEAEFREFD
ncbi:P-loop containing nucleoside triphosphate hydrolase protein [Zopfochytrium polystomum]|nr:P-loop containing nucleoside triphosphate hydrolase protein [Zopfochytrium polystomum]